MSIDRVGEHIPITFPAGVPVKVGSRLEVDPGRTSPCSGNYTPPRMRHGKTAWPIFDASSWGYIYWDEKKSLHCPCGGSCNQNTIKLVETTERRRHQRTAVALCIDANSYVVVSLHTNVRQARNLAIARNVASERRAERQHAPKQAPP